MRKFALSLAVLALVVAAAWIWLDEQLHPRLTFPPIASAEIFNGSVKRQLDSAELAELSRWLDRTKAGWQMVMATPPLPRAYLTIKHTDGRTTGLDLFNDNSVQLGGWRSAVMLTQLPASRDMKEFTGGIQNLTPRDLQPILKLIAP